MINLRDERGFRRTMNAIRPFDCIIRECEWGKETCQPNTGGSHGRGSMRLFVAVEKDNFALSIDWFLPIYHDDTPLHMRGQVDDLLSRGLGEVDYHQPHRPGWDDTELLGEHDCNLLDGGKCFSDGSVLRAGELWSEWMAGKMPDADLYELLEDEWEKWEADR